MTQYHWTNAPKETSLQVAHLRSSLEEILDGSLIGIYLHGSLAMGCFNPLCGDIDLLVVLNEPLPAPLSPRIARLLLDLSLRPHPIEISFLTKEQLIPWRFPTPYDFHYSENWRQKMESCMATEGLGILADASPSDPDLAAHFTILRHKGIVLSGPTIETVFPAVPPQDYLAAIWDHDTCDCAEWIDSNPVYGVLNLCRVLAYVTEGLVVSKDEGGQWALGALTQDHQPVVVQALTSYRGDLPKAVEPSQFTPDNLASFVKHMTTRIIERINSANRFHK